MNENIDLTKILKNCPRGWEFHSSVHGKVIFHEIDEYDWDYPICLKDYKGNYISFSKKGHLHTEYSDVECALFPSKEQRDWSKFTAPWYKSRKFDPKTLEPFDKVLVRDSKDLAWNVNMFSYIDYPYRCLSSFYRYCIPYNNDTKHLLGTTDEAPEYYRYWED